MHMNQEENKEKKKWTRETKTQPRFERGITGVGPSTIDINKSPGKSRSTYQVVLIHAVSTYSCGMPERLTGTDCSESEQFKCPVTVYIVLVEVEFGGSLKLTCKSVQKRKKVKIAVPFTYCRSHFTCLFTFSLASRNSIKPSATQLQQPAPHSLNQPKPQLTQLKQTAARSPSSQTRPACRT